MTAQEPTSDATIRRRGQRGRWRLSPSEIVFVILGLASVLGFAAVSMTVNSLPTPREFDGWIAVLQQGRSRASQVTVSISPEIPGGSGDAPALRYAVAACGPTPFQGALLVGGAARLRGLHVTAPPAPVSGPAPTRHGEPIGPIRNLKMLDVATGSYLTYRDAQLIRLALPASACVGTSPASGSFLGAAAVVAGHARAPVEVQARGPLGLWTAPRSTESWPYLGGLPGIDSNNAGEFRFLHGLHGQWSKPRSSFSVSVGALAEKTTVDFARPTPSTSTALEWEQPEPFAAIARVTHAEALGSWQNYLVAASIALAVGASFVAAIALRHARPRLRAPNVDLRQPAASESSRQEQNSHGSVPLLALIVVLVLGLLWPGRFRRLR
jgi:hypothetical protein